eukprot:9491691-Pyramimonas_sp.AAC.1
MPPRVIHAAEDRLAAKAFIVERNDGQDRGGAVSRERRGPYLVFDELPIGGETCSAALDPAN